MTNINVDLYQWFITFFGKKTSNTNKETEINSGIVSENAELAKN